jgi:excisionase family DNA binding protein
MSATTRADHLITLQAAADRLGISKETVRLWVANGDLPAVRMGPRLIRVDIADVDRLLTPSTTPAQARRKPPARKAAPAPKPTPAMPLPPMSTRDAFADYIARVVEAAPPLSADQVAKISALLGSAKAA